MLKCGIFDQRCASSTASSLQLAAVIAAVAQQLLVKQANVLQLLQCYVAFPKKLTLPHLACVQRTQLNKN
jgi:hypothetical protein